jgi:hypothetical protein
MKIIDVWAGGIAVVMEGGRAVVWEGGIAEHSQGKKP